MIGPVHRCRPKSAALRLSILGATSLAALIGAAPARAAEFDYGDVKGTFDTRLSLGANFRVADRDRKFIGPINNNVRAGNGGSRYSINGDDGNLNYGRGLTSLAARATHELSAKFGDSDFGFFGRFTYFYDAVNASGDTDFKDLPGRTVHRIGYDFRLLDAYAFGRFGLGEESSLSFKLGNQVLNWGESTFIQNSINTINPIDVSALRVPGSELREALLPLPMIDATLSITNNLSIEAFYQFAWHKTDIDPVGSPFSTDDVVGAGSQHVWLGFGDPARNIAYAGGRDDIVRAWRTRVQPVGAADVGTVYTRADDNEADDQGQYGIALRYFSPELNNTDFGLYYINYHSRLPVLSALTGTREALLGLNPGCAAGSQTDVPCNYSASVRYLAEYPEDIQLFGFSFNTSLPYGIALQGEVAFRKDQPLQGDDVELIIAALQPALTLNPASATAAIIQDNFFWRNNPNRATPQWNNYKIQGWREYDVLTAQATLTKAFGPIESLGVDQWVLLGEFGYMQINDYNARDFLLDGPNTTTPGTNSSWLIAQSNPAYPVPRQAGGFATPVSWGYQAVARFDILNAFEGVNLSPTIAFQHDVHGTSPSPVGNFIQDRGAITVGLNADFQQKISGGVSYTNFFSFDRGQYNMLTDRDFLSFNVRYQF